MFTLYFIRFNVTKCTGTSTASWSSRLSLLFQTQGMSSEYSVLAGNQETSGLNMLFKGKGQQQLQCATKHEETVHRLI